MSDLFFAFLEYQRRNAEVLPWIFDAEVRSNRVTSRWIVFSGCMLAFEAAQLGLVRIVHCSNERVEWAVLRHRHVCRLRSINRVRLRNDGNSSSDDSDGLWM